MKIAISCEMDFLASPQQKRSICNQDYVDFVKAAECKPYIVCEGMSVPDIAADMDGLLLSGGKDISPLLYGADLEWNGAKKCNIIRDIFERDLYEAFVKLRKPVFGICRGFQLVALLSNNELKLKFYQDINKLKNITQMHHQEDIVGDNPVHVMECRGVLQKLIGSKVLGVNSFHHQGFVMGGNTTDTAWIQQCEEVFAWGRSREAGRVLEAFGMTVNGGVRVAGVQYHPERMLRREKDRDHHLALFKYTMGLIDVEDDEVPPETTITVKTVKPEFKRDKLGQFSDSQR